MHDTALHIGSLAMNIYADLRGDSVLEVGSRTVNGSLRQNALPTTSYVGVDIQEGEGVDLVIDSGSPLPVDDGAFDLVIASSVFEHDPCFWMTFLEMCRAAKDGGYIYINAPSNGVVHRFPQDNWRFYPDSGKALARWAASQGQAVTLVESFIANRQRDIWNDFVAVFRKGPIIRKLPTTFLHEHVPCTEVITWKSNEIVNPADKTEDMLLLAGANDRAKSAEAELSFAVANHASLEEEASRLREQVVTAEDVRELQRTELERIKGDLNLRESELRQRQEEIEQTRRELQGMHLELQEVRALLEASNHQLESERALRKRAELVAADWRELHDFEEVRATKLIAAAAEANDKLERRQAELNHTIRKLQSDKALVEVQLHERLEEVATVTRELERAQSEHANFREQLQHEFEAIRAQSRIEKERLDSGLRERFGEVALLSTMLAEREAVARRLTEKVDWLRRAGSVLAVGPGSPKGFLLQLLPASVQRKRCRRMLKRRGLFDGDAYIAAHPDVAEAGADPLVHYLNHGIEESRSRS